MEDLTTGDDLTTGLEAGIAKARHQPLLTRSTGIMAALVIACAGFVAGIKAQQSFGATPSSGQQQQQQQGGGTRATGFTGGGANVAPTTGKVKLVDGGTLYVELADGSIVTVKTSATTVIQTSTAVALKDLPPGTDVTVAGSGGGTDTMTATTITAHK
jgi:hypothetical protein